MFPYLWLSGPPAHEESSDDRVSLSSVWWRKRYPSHPQVFPLSFRVRMAADRFDNKPAYLSTAGKRRWRAARRADNARGCAGLRMAPFTARRISTMGGIAGPMGNVVADGGCHRHKLDPEASSGRHLVDISDRHCSHDRPGLASRQRPPLDCRFQRPDDRENR